MNDDTDMLNGFRGYIKLCLISADNPIEMAEKLTKELLATIREMKLLMEEASKEGIAVV